MKFTKTLLVAPLIAGALITSSFAATDNKNDVSYSVGYTMGKTLETQMNEGNITADNNEMISGLKDGIEGDDAKLTPDQMKNAMTEFQKQVIAAQKPAAQTEDQAEDQAKDQAEDQANATAVSTAEFK